MKTNSVIEKKDLVLQYKGSVKNVWSQVDKPNSYFFEYSDRYSIFDWGEMPDHIRYKGCALNLMGYGFFKLLAEPKNWQELKNKKFTHLDTHFLNTLWQGEEYNEFCQKGLSSHYLGLAQESVSTSSEEVSLTSFCEVKKIEVIRPQLKDDQTYDYSAYQNKDHQLSNCLIPLEVMFRLGLAPDNSLSKRLKKNNQLQTQFLNNFNFKKNYENLLSKDQNLLDFSLIDFSTKLEKTDRYVDYAEAQALAGLSEKEFSSLIKKTQLLSLMLFDFHSDLGIELWDGKVEWAFNENREFILVDSIGIDELRLNFKGEKLSKEFLRDFYRKTSWYSFLNLAKQKDFHFKESCLYHYKSHPQALPKELNQQVIDLYLSYTCSVLNKLNLQLNKKDYDFLLKQNCILNLNQYAQKYILNERSNQLSKVEFEQNQKINILVVGSGSREQAIIEQFKKSDSLKNTKSHIFVAPGNAGYKILYPEIELLDFKVEQVQEIVQFAKDNKINLVVIGPEVPLALGLTDELRQHQISVFGPSQFLAQLETSKEFAKQVMQEANIATAEYKSFHDYSNAVKFVEATHWSSMVIKCDGLAAGKGVVVCDTKEVAFKALHDFFENQILGFKIDKIIIEEFLQGPEVSAFALYSDSHLEQSMCWLGTACDHKRLLDDDRGPNTGGMGVISPAPFLTEADLHEIQQKIFIPLKNYFKKKNWNYRGVIFAGLMKTEQGFKVLEFNARFGDPETQTLLNLIDDDFYLLLKNTADGQPLPAYTRTLKHKKAVHVVCAAEGYPGLGTEIKYGSEIHLHQEQIAHAQLKNQFVYFAGVKNLNSQQLFTSGGRVMGVTTVADSYFVARDQAYSALQQQNLFYFSGQQFRRDIGISTLKLAQTKKLSKKRIMILASGRGSNALSLVQFAKVQMANFEVVGIITDQKDAAVVEKAYLAHVPLYQVLKKKNESHEQYQERLALFICTFDIDFVVLAGFMRLLKPVFLNYFSLNTKFELLKSECSSIQKELNPKYRVINIHPSLLPHFPGLTGYEDSFKQTKIESGCTIHFVDEGMDTGEIIFQKVLPRIDNEDFENFKQRGLSQENEIFPQIINEICLSVF